jgi:hypothetical protein
VTFACRETPYLRRVVLPVREHGNKYFFDPDDTFFETQAKENADRQDRALYAQGYRGK